MRSGSISSGNPDTEETSSSAESSAELKTEIRYLAVIRNQCECREDKTPSSEITERLVPSRTWQAPPPPWPLPGQVRAGPRRR